MGCAVIVVMSNVLGMSAAKVERIDDLMMNE